MKFRLLNGPLVLMGVGGLSYVYIDKFWIGNSSRVAKCSYYRSPNGGLKLIGAQIFFRHGARTPLSHANGIEDVSKSLFTLVMTKIRVNKTTTTYEYVDCNIKDLDQFPS